MSEEKQTNNTPVEESQESNAGQNDTPIQDTQKIDVQKQCDEYLDGWKRAKADLINYKKDEAKRLQEFAKFSNETIIRELIGVLDTFDLALESIKDDAKTEKGVYLIRAKLEDILKNYGLERIMVSVGKPFDPALHDAVATVESKEHESGMVVDEVEKGYMMHGKLIRAARVKVAK